MPESNDNAAILAAVTNLGNSVVELREEQHANMIMLARADDVRQIQDYLQGMARIEDLRQAREELATALTALRVQVEGNISVKDCAKCRENLIDKRTFRGYAAAIVMIVPFTTALLLALANHYLNP